MINSSPVADYSIRRIAIFQHVPGIATAGLILLLYSDVGIRWAQQCWEDDSFSHGLLVAPLAVYLAWRQRHRLAAAPAMPSGWGIFLISAACIIYMMGRLGAELFLSRSSFVLLLAGLIWTLRGWTTVRQLAFPLLLLMSAIPIPVIVYNSLSAPLQLLASQASAWVTQSIGISVYRDGNIIQLAGTSLGVAEACSGLRSLASLSVAGLLLGYLECRQLHSRVIVLLLALPIAVFINVLRVAGTAVLAERDPELAMGFYHLLTGWLVFVGGFAILYTVTKTVRWVFERNLTMRYE